MNILNFLRYIKHSTLHTVSKQLTKRAEAKIYAATNGSVITGPFKGLNLINKNVFGSEIPKLIGSYEKELNASLLKALERQPRCVCNIGAAEGYYALGCAQYEGVEQVFAFEALEVGRALINENLQQNQLNADIAIHGLCDENTLWNTLSLTPVDLMLIDIEGAELDILSTRNVELLEGTELIIESHDFCRPGCIDRLKQLFEGTHELLIIDSQTRTLGDFPSEISLSNKMKLDLMNETRPGVMQWLIARPKKFNTD